MAEVVADLASDLVRDAAEPLPDIDDSAFAPMFDRFADARVVLPLRSLKRCSEMGQF